MLRDQPDLFGLVASTATAISSLDGGHLTEARDGGPGLTPGAAALALEREEVEDRVVPRCRCGEPQDRRLALAGGLPADLVLGAVDVGGRQRGERAGSRIGDAGPHGGSGAPTTSAPSRRVLAGLCGTTAGIVTSAPTRVETVRNPVMGHP